MSYDENEYGVGRECQCCLGGTVMSCTDIKTMVHNANTELQKKYSKTLSFVVQPNGCNWHIWPSDSYSDQIKSSA